MKVHPKNRLRELREVRQLNMWEVGKILDLSEAAVSKHETSNRGLNGDQCKAYAKLYKVETHELFFDLDDDPTEVDPRQIDLEDSIHAELMEQANDG